MATLVVLGQPTPGAKKQLQKHRHLIVGRDPTCDLVIQRHSVSRFHAQVVSSNGHYFVEDIGSTNGTFLNGHRLLKREELSNGDRITIHDVLIGFYLSDQVDENVLQLLPTFEQNHESTVNGSLNVSPISAPGGTGAGNLKGQLLSLIEITRSLGNCLQLDEILPRVLDMLFSSFSQATTGEIHLRDATKPLRPVAMKHGRNADSTDLTGAPLNVDLIQRVISSGQGVISAEEASGTELAIDGYYRCTICAPILGTDSIPCGVIILQSDGSSYGFSDGDLNFVSAVGVVAGQSISYAHAHEVVLKHIESERQLEIARNVQLSMLPRSPPAMRGFDFFHYYSAAERVGGDYIFYETTRDGRLVFGIADASGKGLPAAMNVMRFAGEVKLRIVTSRNLKSAMRSLNQFILDGAEECMFITACIGILDPRKRTVTLANAGHPPPLLKRRGVPQIEQITSQQRSFPLGISEAISIFPVTIQLELGDQIFLYTDGASEAMNRKSELFGIERICASLLSSQGSVKQTIQDLVTNIQAYRNERIDSDDLATVGIECLMDAIQS